MQRQTVAWAVALVGAVTLGCGGANGDATTTPDTTAEYAVTIHRPLRTGDRIRVDVETEHVVAATRSGTDVPTEGFGLDLHVALEGLVEVEDADVEGRLVEAKLTIDQCVDPGTGQAIFAPGSVVDVSRIDDEVSVALEGGNISRAQVAALVLAFPFERPGSPLGDELLGTETPKRVGDGWTVDRRFVAEDFLDDGFETEETNIAGNVRLTDVIACDEERCLVIEARLEATQATMVEFEDDATFEAGQLEAQVLIHAPVNAGTFLRREEATLTGRFVADFETEDGIVEREITVNRRRLATYAPAEAPE